MFAVVVRSGCARSPLPDIHQHTSARCTAPIQTRHKQEEISRQDQHVSRLHTDAHVLQSKLNTVNRDGFKF